MRGHVKSLTSDLFIIGNNHNLTSQFYRDELITTQILKWYHRASDFYDSLPHKS